MCIRGHAAHVVMRSGGHGDRLDHRVDAVAGTGGCDGGILGQHRRAQGRTGVEHGAQARLGLGKDRAGHDVTRGEFGQRVDLGHEPRPLAVDQMRAGTAQGFGCQGGGVFAAVDGGGVELHEFCIGDERACPCRHADHLPPDPCRVGRQRIKPARPATRQQDPRAAQQDGGGALGPSQFNLNAGDFAAVAVQSARQHAFEYLDRRGIAHLLYQGAHNLGPGLIALHPHHTRETMRRLAGHDIAPVGAAVEGGAKVG